MSWRSRRWGCSCSGWLLAEPVSRALAAAHWPARDPVGALLVWQAVGLAGGLALVGAGVVYGLAPLGPDLPAGAARARGPRRSSRSARATSSGWRSGSAWPAGCSACWP